jgi:rsbT co-antagonist protein RsbR
VRNATTGGTMGYGQITVDEELTHYRQMIDSITEYEVIRLDHEGRVRTWHPGAEKLTQYAADEIVGKPVTVFYTAEDLAAGQVDIELRTAAATGRYETEGWRVRKDGSRFWASVSITPMRDGNGFVKVVRDVTDRVAQEQVLRSVEQMVDAITDYEVIRLDRDGVIRSWNPGAQRLKQYTADEVIGHHVSMFYDEEDMRAGLADRELATAVSEGRFEGEGWRIRKDGGRIWMNVVISPIRDQAGELAGFVKVSRDLTERREQERLLQRQRDEILELSTPVIEVWDKVLVLPIIGTLDSFRASRLTEGLLERIAADQAEVAILDVSGVPAVDTDVAQHLLKTVEAARLMGTTSILSGVRPETAQAIVHLGIDLGSLRSRSCLREALQLALRIVAGSIPDELRVSADA